MSNTTATQILFIDSRVPDADVLLAGLDPAIEIVRLNSTESGLQQMANAVQGRSNIASVHVISHGGPGSLLLGSGVVNQSQLLAEQLALSTLQSALSENADLLLYGCDVAAGAEGQSFIDALAAATGADVAASTDLTGGGTAQSDWVLESSTGAIETAVVAPTAYQYDLGYWGNVGLTTGGDRWAIARGSQNTIIFDADGGGKGSKYGVANNVGAYNVSNLYTSAYNGDWEAIWYTFTGSSTAVPGSPWYVSNWDPDAGGYTYWGAYANATPWQTSGKASISIAQGSSQTLYVNDLVNDDYYSANDTWKYFVGGSSSGSTGSYFGVGNSIPKYATFTAQTNISLKGQIYLGSMTYSVNDGVNYGNGNSLNPDYYSAYSRYKSATYTTYVYGTYADDAITWNAAPADQAWTGASRSAFNFGRGAQDPDSIDYITGYSFIGIELKTGASSYAASTTTLPTWLKLNGTTFSVENLAPQFAGLEYRITVRAYSIDGTTIDKTFKLTTGTAAQVNDAPSSVGNSISFNEDVSYTFSDTSFNFTDRDNTVGGSTSTNPAHGSSFVSLKIMSLPNAAAGVLKLNGIVITQAQVDAGLVIPKADIGLLTFEPVANYSGSASFSYKVFDGIDLSAASATMSMTVVSVNDRPIITNLSTDATPVAISSITIADTAAYNTSFTPSVGTLTGTLSATDPELTAVTLGIYGGTVSGSTVTKTGLFGTLILDTATGAWTYNPNKFAAINKLTGNATETFQFKATDANGYSSAQTLTINITGTNDAPVLAAALSDQTFEGAGTWTYTVPANTFIDAEGTSLTYSAVLWDGTNELALSTKGLSFNSTTLVISGDPAISETLVVRVKATDGVNTTVSDDFNLVLSNVGNLAPKVAAPLSFRVTNVPKEVTSVTFGNGVTATSVSFDNVSVSAPTRTGEEVATAVKLAYDAASGTNYTVSRAGNVLTFTGTPGVDLPSLPVSGDLTPTVVNTQEGSGVKESFTLDMSFTVNTAQPMKFIVDSTLFGGVAREIYTVPANSTAINNASAVASALNAASWFSDGWSASSSNGIVTITSKQFGDVIDTSYDGENIVSETPRSTVWFMGPDLANKAGVPPQFITKAVDGTTATSEIKTVTFTTAYANQTLTIDGVTATVPTATGVEIAAAIAGGTYPNYTATADGATVTLTAKAVGNPADITAASFVGASGATVSISTQGVAGWSYQIPAGTFTDPNSDALTYTATWDTTAVPAGSVLSFDANTQTLSGNGTAFNTPITIRATDAGGLFAESAFGLQIYNNTVTPSIAAGSLSGVLPFVDGKGTFTYTLPPTAFVVSGAAAPTYAATLADGTALPAWLGFNTTTGTFSGNPNGTVTDVAVKVTATNAAGSAFVTFTLDVAYPNDPLVLANPVADQTLLTGAAIDFTITAPPFTDPEGQTITYTATLPDGAALPGWLSFDASTRKFTGTPPADLPYLTVKLTGTTADTSVLSTPLTFNFTQTPVNSAGSASLAITTDTGPTGASVGDVVTVSVTDTNGVPGAGVQYQWQTSSDSGTTWQDVVGSRGTTANTLTLTQEEANAQIRVQTYYTDNQGTPEQLTSGVLNVAVNNVAGTIAILGYPAPGDNLFAQLSDANGLSGGSFVAPTYQWYKSTASNFSGETAIAGATGASYTLTPEDGAKYIRVKVSYTDAQGFVTTGLTQVANSGNPMELAPTAPVSVNDTGSAITENSGINNATVGAGSGVSTDNLLTNDTDVNVNGRNEFAVEGVYLGATEGVGTPASVTGTLTYISNAPSDTRSYTLEGRYGSIVVAANGSYTYTLNQSNADVQALAVGQTLTESFNYEMSDGRPAYLTDTATLTITINGANDAPTLSTASALTSIVNEDIASFINTGLLTFVDPDMGATGARTAGVNTDFKVYFKAATGRLLVPVLPAGSTGITVTGSDTGKLTLTGSMAAINDWLSQDRIQYITAPNAGGTATVSVSANDGYGSVSLGSYTLTISAQNDAPLMDLNGLAGQAGGSAGYGLTVLFRPRGDSVLIADTDAAITDADTGDTIQSAVIRLSKGAVDNEFGTIYETLTSSLGSTYTPVVGGTTFTLTGNGTTEISVTGVGTHAQYQEIVRSISYINTNPNAYGGNREITVRLIDTADSPATRLDSNLSMLSLASVNTSVAVGQKIIINGVDSGASVAQLLDNQNFVASRQILELKSTSTIKFATSAVLGTVTSGTSLVLEAGNTSVAVGQKLMVGANERATVTAVSTTSGVTTVTINAGHADIAAGAQVSFETSAVTTQVATTAARKVSSDVSSAMALQLNAIDLTIEVGQKIYLTNSDTGKTVTAVSHSAAGTLVTASAAMSATTAQELTFRTFATNNLPTAVTTIQNVWTTEVDLNGVLDAGRNYTTTFAEGQTGGTNIASSSVSLDNQQVFVKEVVVTLTNAVDGASGGNENLLLNPAYTTVLLGRGITYALSDNDHTLTLSAINPTAGVTAADMQLALRAVQYENTSDNPSVTPRVINVTVTDVANSLTGLNEEGVSAHTIINITPSNDAPTLAGDFAATVLEDGAYTLTTGDLSPSDIDNDVATLRYELTSTSSSITVFRDINGDGQVDAGEAIAVRSGGTAGQEFTQADVIAGKIKVKQNGTDVPVLGLTETEAENLVSSAVYANSAANPSAGLRQVIFQNSTQMSSLGVDASAVTQTTTVDITANASDLFSGIDFSTPATGDSYKTLNFKVTGVSDGVKETITFGSGATAHVVPLVVGSVVKDGTIYTVSAGSSATEVLLSVSRPFAAVGLALRDNGENGVLPVAASLNLTITPVNDAPTLAATVTGGTFIEGGATRSLFSAAAVTDGDTSGAEQDITELKLTITGVRDGSAEKLVVGGQSISLISGAVVGGGLGYSVSVTGSTASVTLTKTDSASAWATLINGMAYQNTSIAPTNGNRVLTLTSLKDSGGTANSGSDTKALNLSSTVTVQGIDSAPVVTSNGALVQNGGLLTITTASPVMLTATDADTAADALVYTLTASTAQGTLFLDKNANNDVDEGEALVASAEFTQTDLVNGTLKYFHTGAVGADAFSFRVKDATTTLSSTTFDITIAAAGGVSGSGTSTANSTDGTDPLFQQVAITTNTGESVKNLSFKVSGVTDGSAEYLTVNGVDVHLTAGSTTIGGVTYTVVNDGSGNFTVNVTSATGFTATEANALVNGASYGNDAVPPTSGERAISLATVTTTNGSSTFTTATNIGAVTTVAPTLDVFTLAQAQAAITDPGTNNDIKALTFTVSGIKDGANEVIKISGQEIPLVAGSPVVIDGVTYQVTASTPAGTFIVTMTDATGPGLTEAQAEAIVAGVTLSNSDSTPTDGARSVALSSYSVGLASGTAIASTPTTALSTSTSSTTAVNGASVEPLSGAVLSSTGDIDALTFSVSGVQDGSDEVLVIGGFSVPLVNGASLTNSATPGGTYTVSVTNGVATVVFTPSATLTAAEAETLVRGVDYLNNASPLTEGDRTVSLVSLSDVNSTTPIAQSATGSVSVAVVEGVYAPAQPVALSLFDAADVIAAIPAPDSGNDFKSVSFSLTGIADGAQEVFQVNGQDIPLVPGTVTVNGVTYTVTSSTAGSYTVTVTDTAQPGFSEAALQAMVSGATLTNTSSTATEGVRTVTLGTILQGLSTADTGTTAVTLDNTAPTGSVVAPNTPVNAMVGDSVTVPTGSSVDSLTFTVTGVKDGAAEVLKFGAAPNIISVPLVTGTVTSTDPAGTYAVSVAANGTATVVFTPTVELTPAQANSLIAAATYTNTSNEPTGGVRSLDLISMDVLTGSTVTPTAVNNVGGDIAVQGTTEGAPVFDASDVLPTADLAGKTVDSMTFTVAGVKDGANEVLLVNGLAVPLVAGTVASTSPAGAYVVTVNGSGTATVVFTPTTNLTEAQANALLEGMTYDNKSTDVTGGDRVVSLSSLVTTNPDGTGSATISPTTINGSLPVLEAPPEYVPLFNPTQVNAAIAAPTDGNDYKSISFDLTGIADGANEIFKVNGQSIPLVPGTMTVNGVTYTVTGSGTTYTVTVTDTVLPGFTEADLQTLVNGTVLINTASTPTEGLRAVTLGSLLQGASQATTVTLGGAEPHAAVVATNTPVHALAGDAVAVASGSTVDSLTFTVTGVGDGAAEMLKFGTTTVPLVNGTVASTDPAGSYSVTVSGGTATVVFTPTTNLSAAATNALIAGVTYTNTDTTPTEGIRSLSLTSMAVDNGTTVTQTSVSTVAGQIPVKASTSPLFDSTAVATAIPAVTSGNDFKSVSFDLTGIADGAAEVFRVNGQDIPLVAGAVTVAGVTYTVTGTGPAYTVTVTDTIQPGFTEAALQTLVAGATLTNTASSPSEGARGVTLGSVTQGLTGTSTVNLTSAVSATVLAPDTPVRAMQGDSVVVDDSTSSVDSMTFTVTGVKDGAAEVLTFGTTTVPLVNGTVTSTNPAGSFLVTVNDAGTATVVFRPTVNLTDAQTDALIAAATYTNTSSTPTGGVRSLDLTSMDIQTTAGGAVTATPVTGVSGAIPVQGVIEGESVFNSSALVPTLTGGNTIDSLTFGVSGVKDGSNEVLVINGVSVPLVPTLLDNPISDGLGGSYAVTVDASGNAVVVYTPASNLTEAQANALLSGITYDNKSSNVSDGARGFSVISMDTVDSNSVTTTTATPGLNSAVSYGTVTNTAPVVTVNAGVTVAENQTVTLSAANLAVTDGQQNNLDLVLTVTDAPDRGQLFRDLNGNGLVNSGEALDVGSTFTQAELVGGRIKYRHDGSETRSDAFKFTVSDGVDTTAVQPFAISVTSVNDMPSGRPSIDGLVAQHAVLTASLASLTDGDGLPTLASMQYTWKADGQTVGTNAPTYTLTASEIDKKITVTVAYTDLSGFSHTVTSLATAPVVNVNDAPTLSASALTVFEGGTITLNTSQIVAADEDGLTLDHQFKLVTAPTQGQIYLDVNGNGVLDSGSESVLATNGTFTQDDLFSGRVRYQHLGSENNDGFDLQVIDGGGLASATTSIAVTRTAVNDAPTIQNLNGDVIAVPTVSVPVLLDNVAGGSLAAVVADVDSADLAGGELRVAVNFNRNPAKDSLAIKQVGTGTGQISTSGSDVKFGGTTIGTFTGGSGANDLLVTLNASATKAAIAALISAITFQNDESIPAESVRTVSFTLTDGDGGTSDVARVTVNLEANGAPTFLNASTTMAVYENSTQVGVFAATDPLRLVTTYSISSRDDSANADRDKFSINASTGVLTFVSAPDFEAPADAGTDNHYQVVVRATNANGYSELPVEIAIIDQVTGTGEIAVDRTPPAYVMGTLSGTNLVLYFSEATSLNAVNKPDPSAFRVNAGNTAVAIAALAVNASAKTVTLTLASSPSSAADLTVTYTDPTAGNDPAALQDIAGNDTASFTVSNIVAMTGGGGTGGATGVTPTIENQVTSLAISNAVAGDGNGDGIADANQSAVASVPMMITNMPESAPNLSAMTYITLVAASVNGKVGASEVARITEVTQRDMPANLPTAVVMPMGLIDFTANVAVAGSTNKFSLYVDSTLNFNGYWKQNSEGVWTNLASSAFGGSITEEGGKLRIDFTIKDGGEFDEDGLANGVIVDPGAVGTVPLSIVGMHAERPVGEGWF